MWRRRLRRGMTLRIWRGHERLGGDRPAVPLQTLSRVDAGLKPPEYVERNSGVDSEGAVQGGRGFGGEGSWTRGEAGGVMIVIVGLSREYY